MYKTKRFYWLAQILGWGSLAVLIFLAGLSVPKHDKIPITTASLYQSSVILFVSGVIVSHLMRFVFLKLGWLRLSAGKLIGKLILLTIIASLVMELVDYVSTAILAPKLTASFSGKFIFESLVYLLFLGMWNGIYMGYHFAQKSRFQEVNNLQLTASRNEIELKNLRSQLNPHFLFNSLNSIRALVDLDPSQAKENITTLANLLRKSLILGKEKLITLKEELDLVNDYLDLEKVRFEERLHIEVQHDSRLDDLQVPPFIVQTLVENAFKHGISRLVEGGTISISTGFSGNTIVISVENDGKLVSGVPKGIGLENTRRRLELLYGPLARFSLKQNGDKVLACIELTQ